MKVTVGILLAALAAGCSTDKIHEWTRAKPVPLTDFLPENGRLVRRADTFLVHYTWLDTNAVATAEFKTEGEPSALLQFSKYTYTSSAKINLKKLAEECVLACKTKVEDRAGLRRSFPLDFIALPWETNP